jgi:very-short-patch-repair endonuclease
MYTYNPLLEAQAQYLRLHRSEADRVLEAFLRQTFPTHTFELKVPIDDFIVDFLFPSQHLVIELDTGQQENTDAYVYHAERKEALEKLGLKVVRIEEAHIPLLLTELLPHIAQHLS